MITVRNSDLLKKGANLINTLLAKENERRIWGSDSEYEIQIFHSGDLLLRYNSEFIVINLVFNFVSSIEDDPNKIIADNVGS